MVMEAEHPMDEPAPEVVNETEVPPSTVAPAEEDPAAKSLLDEYNGPDDEKASEGKIVETEKEESPATEEMENVATEEDKEGEKEEKVADEKQEETAVPEAPATEGKDESTEEAAPDEEEKELDKESDKESAKEEAAEVEDVSEEAKRETNKLKTIFSGMRKSIKKKVKSIKEKKKSKSKSVPASGDEEQEAKATSNENVDDNDPNPAEESPEDKEDTDSESGEREGLIKNLRGSVLSLEEENKELKRLMRAALASGEPEKPFDEPVSDALAKEFETMTPNEKIKRLDSQVQKWQKLYLESNEIGPSRIERLEEGCDEASSMARSTDVHSTKEGNKGEKEDRILMLEYQLRESVKVLKTAQKKMVAQHEKEFHLQKTVDDLSEQINELDGQVEKVKESEQQMKATLEQEEQQKLQALAELAQERERLDDFREDMGLAPLYKNQATIVDDQVEEQVQTNNSSIFCWGESPVQPISQ